MDEKIILTLNDAQGNGMSGNGNISSDIDLLFDDIEFSELTKDFV